MSFEFETMLFFFKKKRRISNPVKRMVASNDADGAFALLICDAIGRIFTLKLE